MPTSPFCPQCGKQFTPDANFCSTCGAYALPAPQPLGTAQSVSQMVRPRHPRMVAGVCSGIAIHYGWDVALIRVLYAVFVCLTLTTGLVAYAVAWLLLPDAQYALPATTSTSPIISQ